MKNRRLVLWNSKEDCIVYHRAEGREAHWVDHFVEKSMLYGNFVDERRAFDLAESYDVRVV